VRPARPLSPPVSHSPCRTSILRAFTAPLASHVRTCASAPRRAYFACPCSGAARPSVSQTAPFQEPKPASPLLGFRCRPPVCHSRLFRLPNVFARSLLWCVVTSAGLSVSLPPRCSVYRPSCRSFVFPLLVLLSHAHSVWFPAPPAERSPAQPNTHLRAPTVFASVCVLSGGGRVRGSCTLCAAQSVSPTKARGRPRALGASPAPTSACSRRRKLACQLFTCFPGLVLFLFSFFRKAATKASFGFLAPVGARPHHLHRRQAANFVVC
jgi:hypothetical protein